MFVTMRLPCMSTLRQTVKRWQTFFWSIWTCQSCKKVTTIYHVDLLKPVKRLSVRTVVLEDLVKSRQ